MALVLAGGVLLGAAAEEAARIQPTAGTRSLGMPSGLAVVGTKLGVSMTHGDGGLQVRWHAEMLARSGGMLFSWTENDLSGLRAFLDRTPACVAAVLAYNGTETAKLGERLWAIPMGKLLE